MMNSFKKLILFRLLIITSNLVKKTDYDTKIGEIEKKMLDHDTFIILDTFAERLKQAKLKLILMNLQKKQILLIT